MSWKLALYPEALIAIQPELPTLQLPAFVGRYTPSLTLPACAQGMWWRRQRLMAFLSLTARAALKVTLLTRRKHIIAVVLPTPQNCTDYSLSTPDRFWLRFGGSVAEVAPILTQTLPHPQALPPAKTNFIAPKEKKTSFMYSQI